MITYNKLDAISAKPKNNGLNVEDVGKYGDVYKEIMNIVSYTDIDSVDIDFFDDNTFLKECDYCGATVKGNALHGGGVNQGRSVLTQRYVNPDSDYPHTNDCCGREECKEAKRRLTTWIRYGVDHYSKTEEQREKFAKALKSSGKWEVPCSRQQRYLANLLGGEVNVKFSEINGYVDILLSNNVIIEYDGSGHFLGEHYKRYTIEEKILQDYERDMKMSSIGYRTIRISSVRDLLPSDEVIMRKIEEIVNHLDKTGESLFKWEIPKSKKSNEYGALREIVIDDV